MRRDRRHPTGPNSSDIIGAICLIGFVLLAFAFGLLLGA